MAVVVLPTPPFWFTTATTGGSVVANILGSDAARDPISGGIGRILAQCPRVGRRGWSTPRLQAPAAQVGPHRVTGEGDQPRLDDYSDSDQPARNADPGQQVVAHVAYARGRVVGVFRAQAYPDR